MAVLEQLAKNLSIGTVIRSLEKWSPEHLHHWKQGEFHHDLVVRLNHPPDTLPGRVLVLSTNCNGGLKEILCLDDVPLRWALWKYRCPENPEFEGDLPAVRGMVRTTHYFDPCQILKPDARSELRAEFRRRQRGGGWVGLDSDEELSQIP